ncbi:MAG: hypothetical protein Q4E60_09860 [Bacteroidales bacterium]|nr:hypothetical protein [Bacteroidales bacterium]
MKAITFILSTLFATQITWAQQQDVTTVNLLSDGSTYTGDMKNNLPHGQGTFVMASGDKYVGQFQDGKYEGFGTYTYANGAKYVGEWHANLKHGSGTYVFDSGDKFTGEFKNDMPHGQGIMTYANGDEYIGQWKEFNRSGQGTMTFADGDKYVGQFQDDQYEGEYKDGEYNGFGTYTFFNGEKHVGIWENGQLIINGTPSEELSETLAEQVATTVSDLVPQSAIDAYNKAIDLLKAQNYTQAAKLLREAANQGLADAQWAYGLLLFGGKGVSQNQAEAVKWYRKAAEQDHANACLSLGKCYNLGELALDDGSNIAISIVQYSDTGFFENSGNSRIDLNTFATEEESGSKLLFIIEMAPKKKDWVWDVEDIVNNKEYASINHTKTVLKKKGCVQGLYSFPIERFIDEKSTLEALQEFLDFCKENDIAELEIM